jgi:hypothetical protein
MESAMNISRLVLVTALGLGLSSTGCLGNTDPLVENIEPPRFKTLVDPGGGIGTNGLLPSDYQANLQYLLDATYSPLVQDGSFSDQLIANDILLTPEGRKTLNYAVGCAFDDEFDLEHNTMPYSGEGLLDSTAGWTSPLGTGLSLDGRQDLFACIAARMNPYEDPVQILLIGDHVPNDQADQSAFTFDEALWIVKMVGTALPQPEVHVWPLGDMKGDCRPLLDERFQSRYCGLGLKDCGLTVRYDDNACTESLGFYTCDGQPAIKTKLKPVDVSKLHGGCGL